MKALKRLSLIDGSAPQLDYGFTYRYGAANNDNSYITTGSNSVSTPHRLEEISNTNGDLYHYDYDAIGNIRQQVITNNSQNLKTDNYCWNENATLKGWSNGDQSANGMAAHYVYDHSGERVLKTIAYGGLATVNNSGNVVMAMESPTVYVNPYYIATPYQEAQLVSKHYYMGGQRVASSVTDLRPQPWSTPPSGEEYELPNQSTAADAVIMDFVETMNCVFNDQIQFGFGDMLSMPQLDEIAFVDCEEGTVVEEFEPFLTENLQCACEQGTYWVSQYEFSCNEVNVMYWYHPDYLGSVEAVTDADGEVYQFFHNTIWGDRPSGNNPVDCFREGARLPRGRQQQKAFLFNNFTSRYRFNGKERDWETGNYYYGARYYDPEISVWLGVDPLASTSANLTPYHFVSGNPLNRIDPDGRKDWRLGKEGEMTLTNENIFYARNSDGQVRQLSSEKDLLKGEVLVDKIIAEDDESSIYIESFSGFLSYRRPNKNGSIEKARWRSFGNVDDAEELYEFGANHTNVEWAFAESRGAQGKDPVAFVGNNDGGHSWLVDDFERIMIPEGMLFHVSHSHISHIEGASRPDMENAFKVGDGPIRTVYDVSSGYLGFDQFTLQSYLQNNRRFNEAYGHDRPKQK